jgi:hypothetical protein
MGQFSRHIFNQLFSELTGRSEGGRVELIDHCVEFFPPLKRGEKRERFSVGCYRSGQLVKLRRILNSAPSSYVRICREFEDSVYDLVRETYASFHHEVGLLLLDKSIGTRDSL